MVAASTRPRRYLPGTMDSPICVPAPLRLVGPWKSTAGGAAGPQYGTVGTGGGTFEPPDNSEGKPMLGRVNRFWDTLVSGWQVQAAYEGQSGQPLGFGNAIFNGNLADVPLPVGERMAERWFNTEAGFERRAAFQLGGNWRQFPLRFSGIRGDGINNVDASFMKRFRITESVNAQFRMEAINAANHVQFADPNVTPTSTAFGSVSAEKGHGQRQINFVVKIIY